METYPKISKLRIRREILFAAIVLVVCIVLLVVTAETFLRWRGIKPWQKVDVPFTVYPGEKFFCKHPTLGYSHIPGEFVVSKGEGFSFRVTHLPNTLRITHPLNTYKQDRIKEEIWIFGCSYTHGWTLNDRETYPWLLQERFPEYEVVNFGVSGYGTIQSLIQFREALDKGRIPKFVLVTYASWHDDRNVFSRGRNKTIAPYNKLGALSQPYARLNTHDSLIYYLGKVEYREFPLMRYSSLLHFIEQLYNKFECKSYRAHDVSKALILEMANIAKKYKIIFTVVGIENDNLTREMLLFVQKNGIKAIDIAVDQNIKENTNYPYDGHPSAKANNQYAKKLEGFMTKELLK